ncbi:MAG: TrbC/VirB2 family protein [Rhodospirillaceae bacterium]|jgi:type IV secretory pathway VirB2 component (pilin)|nr:TrbC/VirB2 family protein [Rhodospirillaceae bacterium]
MSKFLLLLIIILLPSIAYADPNWVAPAEKGITALTGNIAKIAAGIVGLGVVCMGVWAAATQRIEWNKLWILVFAGLLITVGPSLVKWFLELMG